VQFVTGRFISPGGCQGGGAHIHQLPACRYGEPGWLAERLAAYYGRPQLIKDVDSIQLGNDFAEVIAAAVTSSDALLALIGHQWLAAAAGPNDFVRVEIESALTRGIRVIPVLVGGARMPTAAELPPGLAMLAQQPPLSLGAADPEGDVSRLTQVLDQTIAARSAQWQATQGGQAQNQPTVTGMAPSWGAPAIYASPSEPRQNEVARPSSAGSGLSGVTPMNLDASVDVRTLSGAAQGSTAWAWRSGATATAISTPSSSRTTPWPSRSGSPPGPGLPASPPRSASATCTWARPAGCGPWSRPSTAARRST
jgi:hypothetical protein